MYLYLYFPPKAVFEMYGVKLQEMAAMKREQTSKGDHKLCFPKIIPGSTYTQLLHMGMISIIDSLVKALYIAFSALTCQLTPVLLLLYGNFNDGIL